MSCAYVEHPITFDYPALSAAQIQHIRQQASVSECQSCERIKVINTYHQIGYAGTLPKVYARTCVWQALQTMLMDLPAHLGIYLFDAFRTQQTQQALFTAFQQHIAQQHPQWTDAQVLAHALTFVSDPKQTTTCPPHNSGGAVDLCLYDCRSGQPLDFGSAFDATIEMSYTGFFENPMNKPTNWSKQRWQQVQHNRRLLYHAMCAQGFTNYRAEWWHFDMGDRFFAEIHQQNWQFDSMETQVLALQNHKKCINSQ